MKKQIQSILDELICTYPALSDCRESILAAYESLVSCYRQDGTVLVCGNGGSAADAEHMVGELMKDYLVKRPVAEAHAQKMRNLDAEGGYELSAHLQQALRAISLVSQTSLISAICNDVNAEMAFAQQVYGYGREGDVLVAISTSGNAANVCNAAVVARGLGITIIGLTGMSGGKLRTVSDIAVCVPADKTYRIQEYHQPIYHALCAMLELEFFGRPS